MSAQPFFLAMMMFLVSAPLVLAGGDGAVSVLEHPRYKENPIYLFFESYIRSVIGQLPPERESAIAGMNLQKVFRTDASEWRAVVREVLHLSETIDIAILDLWYRNREHFRDDSGAYDAIWFSQVFTDEYMKDASQVDVWSSGALEAAKARIRDAQTRDGAK